MNEKINTGLQMSNEGQKIETGHPIEHRQYLGSHVMKIEDRGSIFGDLGVGPSFANSSDAESAISKRRQESVVAESFCCVAIFTEEVYNNAFRRAKQKEDSVIKLFLSKWLNFLQFFFEIYGAFFFTFYLKSFIFKCLYF